MKRLTSVSFLIRVNLGTLGIETLALGGKGTPLGPSGRTFFFLSSADRSSKGRRAVFNAFLCFAFHGADASAGSGGALIISSLGAGGIVTLPPTRGGAGGSFLFYSSIYSPRFLKFVSDRETFNASALSFSAFSVTVFYSQPPIFFG